MIYPDMAALENALLSRLGASQELHNWGAVVESLPGLTRKEDFVSLFGRLPGVGTYCGGGKFELVSGGQAKDETARVVVVCAGGNMRNPAASLKGGPDKPGAIALVRSCVTVLEAWPVPEGNLQRIEPKEWALAWCNKSIAVCLLQVEAVLTRSKAPTASEAGAYGQGYP